MNTRTMETSLGCLRPSATASLIWLAISMIAFSESFAGESELTFNESARRWRDTTGNYEVDASLVKYDDRKVTLRGDDGVTIDVSIDNLSATDQVYLVRRLRIARSETARLNRISRAESDVTEQVDGSVLEVDVPLENLSQSDRPLVSEQLFGVDWYSADAASQIATSEGKPIVWFRVLGDLSGFM